MRLLTTTYVYDDPEHPERPTSAISSPAFTAEDQALLMGLDLYERDLCRCDYPRSVAWHSEMDGFFEGEEYTCMACTAGNDGKPVTYSVVRNTRNEHDHGPMPPFELGVTTVSP